MDDAEIERLVAYTPTDREEDEVALCKKIRDAAHRWRSALVRQECIEDGEPEQLRNLLKAIENGTVIAPPQ